MFPKIFPFFSQNGRIGENFGKHTKFSHDFSQCSKEDLARWDGITYCIQCDRPFVQRKTHQIRIGRQNEGDFTCQIKETQNWNMNMTVI